MKLKERKNGHTPKRTGVIRDAKSVYRLLLISLETFAVDSVSPARLSVEHVTSAKAKARNTSNLPGGTLLTCEAGPGRRRRRVRRSLVTPGQSDGQDPKPLDLGVARLKPWETVVEDRTGAVLRNARMSCVTKEKPNLVWKYLGLCELNLSSASVSTVRGVNPLIW